jgi:VCBS repeat-containing protein
MSPPDDRRRLSRTRRTRLVVLELLEPRTVPTTLTLNPVADGLVADRNLDGVYDAVDTSSTSVTDRYFDSTYASGIGQERDVFEFNLSGIASGTPILSATLGLNVLSYTSSNNSGVVTYPQATIEAYRGTGSITTADGGAAATVAGSGSVSALGMQQFTLSPTVLQALEGGVAAVRLENPTLNANWFQVSDMRDTLNPHPVLTLTLGSTTPIAVNDSYTAIEATALMVPAASGVLANDTDPNGQALTASLVSNPSHGTVTLNGDGSFTYTPAANYFGTDSFTYQASDGTLTSSPGTVTITIASSDAPPVVANDAYTVAQGATFTTTTVPPATPAPLLRYGFDEAATGNAPAQDSGQAPAAPGTFTGGATRTPSTPGFASTGALDLSVPGSNTVNAGHVSKLDSATALTVTAWINVRSTSNLVGKELISDANVPGSFTSGWDFTFASTTGSATAGDTAVSFLVYNSSGAGQGKQSPAFTASNRWVFVAATLDANRSLTLYEGDTSSPVSQLGTPATLSYGLAPNAASLIVGGSGYAPTSPSYTPSTWVDDVRIYNTALTAAQLDAVRQSNLPAGVLANDTSSGGPLTAALVSGPSHGSLTLNADGTFSYTPAAGYVGTDRFTYQASDGLYSSSPATVTLNVVAPPTAVADRYAVAENGSLSVAAASGVLANDTDPNGLPLTATLQSAPNHGTVTLNPDGSFTYTPTAGYSGTDTFSYIDGNGTLSGNVATVTVNVDAPPVSAADTYATPKATPLTVPAASGVLANDTDPNGLTMTASLVSGPSHGNITLNADGSFTYTPAAGYFGPDSFTYQATDGVATGNTATVTLKVSPPTAVADSAAVNENAVLSVAAPGVLGNDTDPNGLPMTASVLTGPAHGTLTLNGDGSYTYTPAAGYFGPDSFTYQASDGAVTSLPATVSITVNQVGTISGTVWDDLTASGTRVLADPGLGGRTVFVDLNHNGTLDAGEPSAITAADGTYTITAVPPGTYSVVAALPNGWAPRSRRRSRRRRCGSPGPTGCRSRSSRSTWRRRSGTIRGR